MKYLRLFENWNYNDNRHYKIGDYILVRITLKFGYTYKKSIIVNIEQSIFKIFEIIYLSNNNELKSHKCYSDDIVRLLDDEEKEELEFELNLKQYNL